MLGYLGNTLLDIVERYTVPSLFIAATAVLSVGAYRIVRRKRA